MASNMRQNKQVWNFYVVGTVGLIGNLKHLFVKEKYKPTDTKHRYAIPKWCLTPLQWHDMSPPWRLISSVFVQQFVQAYNNEYVKASNRWTFVREIQRWPVHHLWRICNTEIVPCHDAFISRDGLFRENTLWRHQMESFSAWLSQLRGIHQPPLEHRWNTDHISNSRRYDGHLTTT